LVAPPANPGGFTYTTFEQVPAGQRPQLTMATAKVWPTRIGIGGHMKTLASVVFLIDSLIIGLGAFGHGLQARRVHEVLDPFPIEPDLGSMIYVVWYFVSGCMLLFGVTLIWVWQRLRLGDTRSWFVAAMIGLLYVGIGVFGLVYRHGDPFMAFFVLLGAVLLVSGQILVR
jgi:hypothetical protein